MIHKSTIKASVRHLTRHAFGLVGWFSQGTSGLAKRVPSGCILLKVLPVKIFDPERFHENYTGVVEQVDGLANA